jgi:hypothetical protein
MHLSETLGDNPLDAMFGMSVYSSEFGNHKDSRLQSSSDRQESSRGFGEAEAEAEAAEEQVEQVV